MNISNTWHIYTLKALYWQLGIRRATIVARLNAGIRSKSMANGFFIEIKHLIHSLERIKLFSSIESHPAKYALN